MIRWIILFLILSIISAIFGYSGMAAAFADIAKAFFFVTIAALVIIFVLGIIREFK